MKHRGIQLICTILLLGLFCPAVFAQEEAGERGFTLEALQQMPVASVIQPNGDVFLQRSRSDVERIIGAMPGQSSAFDETEQIWIGYLEKPHPSVSVMRRYFDEAAQEFGVPTELLQAIGQVESNWTQMGPSIDQGWGVMHLVQNEYVDTLSAAANLLGVSTQILKDDARQNIRGAAALLAQYAGDGREQFTSLEEWFAAVKRFSALDGEEFQTMQTERYFEVLREGIQKPTLWNEQINLNAHPNVNLQIPETTGKEPVGSVDYSPAKSYLYSSCTYTVGRTHKIDTWVNHWIGYGTYAGAISYLARCDIKASAHFVIKQNGEITQTVRVQDTAWHAGVAGYPNNSRSIGIEHEAVVTDPSSWNHAAMLKASAEMARYFANKYGIPKQRVLPGIRGHNEMPGTATQCPGNLPWTTWMNYLNGSSPAAPRLASGLNVFTNNPSSQPIEYGQWMEANFTVKNYGGEAITFTHIGVGGRAPVTNGGNPDNSNVYDLGFEQNITLKPNEQRTFSFKVDSFGKNGVWGKYRFTACYRLANGAWYNIPVAVSGARTEYEFQVVSHAAPLSLANGVGRADYAPRKGYDHFYVDLPANTTSLEIKTTGGRSENFLNLYHKAGSSYPTTASYDHRAISSFSNETLTIANPAAGRHSILVDGYYNGGTDRGTPYTITATWYNPTTPAKKSLLLVSDPGTHIKELNQGAVAAWLSPYWNTSLVSGSVKWIWSSYYTTESENRYGATRTFQEPFSIPAGARNVKGSIDISADDRFKLLLNGSQFAENGDHRYIRNYSFTPRIGNNLLEIAGINAPGPIEPDRNAAGVIYKASITYDLAHLLTVNKSGNGSGTVNGVGIICGSDCSEEYGDGATVTVSAAPAPGSIFAGWSGACSGTGACSVTMTSANTVTAAFTTNRYTILASEGPGGHISPEGSVVVNHGESKTFAISPDSGFEIATVLVDGKTVNPDSTYTFANVNADHTIKAYFKQATHTIQVSAGVGGAISPAGQISVTHGANQAFNITPDAGYRVADVQVDDASVGTVSTYTFNQVIANHSIAATFELIPVDPVILTIDDSRGKPGETKVPVQIALENSKNSVASLQFRVSYEAGKGIHAAGGSAGYQLTPRTQGYAVSVTVAENGETGEALVVLYHFSGGEIASGSGAILELLFNVDATATPGAAAALTFTEAVVADRAGLALASDSKDTAILTIEEPYELGDINADGAVNVLDLQLLINCVLNGGTCPRGDMNGDGLFNVLDVQLLINKINGVAPTVAAPSGDVSLASSGITLLTLPDMQLQRGTSGTIGLHLLNDLPVAAGQLTFMYDSTTGMDITGVALTDRSAGFFEPVGFVKDDRDAANVKIMVLFYALDGTVIEPGLGDILEFSYTTAPEASGDLAFALIDALLVTLDGVAYPSEIENGEMSIEDPSMHVITATAGSGGTITPAGTIRVKPGANLTLAITAQVGYHIKEVIVNGISEGAVSSYTFEQINADHLIEVRFAADAGQLSSYFGFEEHGGVWSDADKSPTNPDDDWLCWAAAAANILEWTGWNVFDSALDAFYTFQNYWSNAGSLMQYAWNWWFDGTEPEAQSGWAQVDVEDGGNYWADYHFFDYFYEDWAWDALTGQWSDGSGLLDSIAEYLHSGYGTTIAAYTDSSGHALTVWGYEYDEYGSYTGIYVTDSDDDMTDLKLLSVSLIDDLWRLDANNQYGYSGWFIGGVQALAQLAAETPVPEPGTLLLIGLGLSGILALRRKRRKKSA